ncbi:zinc finger protein, putative [Pediculus humanus corporis]|uniref:Zinc finger protein, putative n=1 Tax=Pediculus humanus subsp. corporis TaxID=121224 RepID=E0VUT9_PEDHC|nr:zinc finger protein, putative [Pediculus humanus corporis]EEB17145.1 zinc finger protein, putative [Pediculus humanus corporis]
MAAEMQEKFRMLLATKQEKPKIKIKSLDDINKEAVKECNNKSVVINDENYKENFISGWKSKLKSDLDDENIEMNLDVAVEIVGSDVNTTEVKLDDDITTENNLTDERNFNKKNEHKITRKKNKIIINGSVKVKDRKQSMTDDDDDDDDDENEADTSDSDRLVIQDEEKPNPSLLHCLLLKGKQQMPLDIDHDYLMKVKEEDTKIKQEPADDQEDEDIAEEIAEDRLNQIIKDEMDSETDQESEPDENSDIEITEMEVKVDPTLYFSNASQSGNEIEQDSQDGQDSLTVDSSVNSNSNSENGLIINTKIQNLSESEKKETDKCKSGGGDGRPLVMTRLQQKMNPVIASLKLGKPYKCTLCPRSFITDIGLQNHLWSHLPKSRKSQSNGGSMIPKNIDLEGSQVYSSNGVLHTAHPSENPHLLKYVCPICGKKISTKGNLKVHLETHRPKGKYVVIYVEEFKTAANLFRHKDYHGGVQFPCPVCGRVYPTNSTLRAHSITHSDLRPHKCPLCSKTFKRNQDLKFHINQHTGARPYQCPYCPKAFASSGNCFSHRKRMHPLEVERDKERAAEIMG